jgi:hypothetical protein
MIRVIVASAEAYDAPLTVLGTSLRFLRVRKALRHTL